MKKHFDNRELCHIWAHKGQEEGYGSNTFFKGDSIYSYGRHFEMGRHVTRKGQSVILVTTRGYSNTTARHLSFLRQAVHSLGVFIFNVPLEDGVNSPGKWFNSYKTRIAENLKKAKTATTYRQSILENVESLVTEGNRLAEFYGLESRLSLPENFNAMMAEAHILHQKAAKRRADRNEERNRLDALEYEEKLEAWKNGSNVILPYNDGNALLRLSKNGEQVETSMNARVPVEHAQRAYNILKAKRERNETYHTNGTSIHVGHYVVESMNAIGGLKIGCHNIAWEEVERLAQVAGW